MDSLSAIASLLTTWIVGIGSTVNDLPGVVAFGLGLFTWFTAEQILRRLVSGLRWVILIGVLAGLGLTVPHMLGLMFERGGETPDISAQE
ncbi:MAG: hypothetical protein ABJ327_15675 [Litoreibacter sp.]